MKAISAFLCQAFQSPSDARHPQVAQLHWVNGGSRRGIGHLHLSWEVLHAQHCPSDDPGPEDA